MGMRAQRFLLLCLSSVLTWTAPLTAQGVTSPVTIIVTDPSGGKIPHAGSRLIPSPDPAARRETDEKGQLSLNLKPGGYAVFVRCPGFQSTAIHIEVETAKELRTFSVRLPLGRTGSPTVSPISSDAGLLVLAYPFHEPIGFSFAELKALPHITVTFQNSHTNVDETYSGVRLADILAKVGAPLGAELKGDMLENYVVATGSDGYGAVLALAEVDPSFHPGEVLVAETMNGKSLDEHSGPLKLVVTEDKRPARSVRNLTTIELRSAP